MTYRTYTKQIVAGFLVAFALFCSAPALPASAQDLLGTEYGRHTGLGRRDVRATAASIIQILLTLLGILTLCIIIYAGFKWMTAGGNTEKTEEAQKTLYAAVIGLLIILGAYSISNFVLKQLYRATTGYEYFD